ncbi:OmpA family protein [Thiomicrorhabdus indica]|uniref:OmpA family protein n=1 Tax=Thiomicrorhabdus indica TaxID=2267253 RepID=UPI002AA6B48E|nr:OmpA family protein [Thiomicrorhabdus indica]
MKKTFLPMVAMATLSVAAFNTQAADIPSAGSTAYVIDKDGDVVRDRWGRCVRSIDWTVETSIDACEGRTPKPAPVVAAPEPKPMPVIAPKAPVAEPAVVPNVPVQFRGFFDTDSSELKPAAFGDLDTYADYLNQMNDASVKVTGHTDSRGAESYNQKLSERRAMAVKSYLEEKGIASDRINANGAGETQPIASNKTAEGRAENRRVEVEIVK